MPHKKKGIKATPRKRQKQAKYPGSKGGMSTEHVIGSNTASARRDRDANFNKALGLMENTKGPSAKLTRTKERTYELGKLVKKQRGHQKNVRKIKAKGRARRKKK